MAYTGGNSGYVRRLGKIPGGAAPALAPAAGYTAWWDASATGTLWQDGAGTVPATADVDPVARWDSKDGSVSGAYWVVPPGGYDTMFLDTSTDAPHRFVWPNNGSVPYPGLATNKTFLQLFDPVTLGKGTAFLVLDQVNVPGTGASVYDGATYASLAFFGTSYGYSASAVYDTALHVASIPGDGAGSKHIFTYLNDGASVSHGRDDTRTASLATAVGYMSAGGVNLTIYDTLPSGRNGRYYEIITYPTTLSEANRKLTEQYLANKYGITIPY